MIHMLERFVIHFASSGMLVMITYFLLRSLWRRLVWRILEKRQAVVFAVICAVPTAFIPPLREAFDVAAGQPLLKAVTDYISWFAGAGVASWLAYRISNR